MVAPVQQCNLEAAVLNVFDWHRAISHIRHLWCLQQLWLRSWFKSCRVDALSQSQMPFFLLAATASTSSQVWATASDRNCFDARENVAVYRSISRPAYGEVKTVKRRIFKHVFLYTWVNFLVLPIKQWCIRRVYQLRRLLSAFQLNLELTCHIFQLLEMESCQGICVMYCTIIITLYTRHNTQIKTIEKKIRNGQSQKRKYDKIHYSTETSSMTVIILSGWNMQISMTLV